MSAYQHSLGENACLLWVSSGLTLSIHAVEPSSNFDVRTPLAHAGGLHLCHLMTGCTCTRLEAALQKGPSTGHEVHSILNYYSLIPVVYEFAVCSREKEKLAGDG